MTLEGVSLILRYRLFTSDTGYSDQSSPEPVVLTIVVPKPLRHQIYKEENEPPLAPLLPTAVQVHLSG